MNIERILSKIAPPPLRTPDEIAMARALLDAAGIATEIEWDRLPVIVAIRDGNRLQVATMAQAYTMAAEVFGTDGGQS